MSSYDESALLRYREMLDRKKKKAAARELLQKKEQGSDNEGNVSDVSISSDDSPSLRPMGAPAIQQKIEQIRASPFASRKSSFSRKNSALEYQLRHLDTPDGGVYVIGVAGASASGKTTVCRKVIEILSDRQVVIMSQDSFYRSLNDEQKKLAHQSDYNFDHPKAFDYDLFVETLSDLRKKKAVKVPRYDFTTHSRLKEYDTILSADVVIVEGILVFYDSKLRDLMDMKIFVDTDDDTRLVRRIRRDIAERGRDLEGILMQWERFVKPSFDNFILPTKRFADLVIPRGGDNDVAINLLSNYVKLQLVHLNHQKEKKKEKKFSKKKFSFKPLPAEV